MLTGLCNKKRHRHDRLCNGVVHNHGRIAGLLAMMPIGWGLAGTADMRTRALEIMHRELEKRRDAYHESLQ